MPNLADRFCRHCGAKLIKSKIDPHYSINTGDKTHNILWRCPKWRQLLIGKSKHTRFITDSKGEMPKNV